MCQAVSLCCGSSTKYIHRWGFFISEIPIRTFIQEHPEALTKITSFHAFNWERYKVSEPKFHAQLRPAVLLVWRPTLTLLEQLPPDGSGFVEYWKRLSIQLGECIGPDPVTYLSAEKEFQAAFPWRLIRKKRCQYYDCLCASHSPKHKMKICTGCWRARYCGLHCQTR